MVFLVNLNRHDKEIIIYMKILEKNDKKNVRDN